MTDQTSAMTMWLAHVTVEATSPIAVGSGDLVPGVDAPIARDVNGMPVIPASTLAGVLRAGCTIEDGNTYFGQEERDGSGSRSKLLFSDALCHWSDNKPRETIEFEPNRDEVNDLLRSVQPVQRDHVRLNEHGVTDGSGKFDRAAAPVGTRFTFEIESHDKAAIKRMQQLLCSGVYLGGATRSGYGALACIRFECCEIDLGKQEQWAERLSCNLVDTLPEAVSWLSDNSLADDLALRSRTWRGQIEGPLLIGSDDVEIQGTHRVPNRGPYSEAIISWDHDTAQCGTRYVVPGSAIKGPVRHRTLYHLRLSGEETASELVDGFVRLCDRQ